MRPTIIEIAKKAGVSIATVSRAFNDGSSIREDTRQKILEIATQLNYRPHPIARSLSRKRTDTIGVILPELSDEFFTEMIKGIDQEAYVSNHYIMVSSSHSQRNIMKTLLEFMDTGRVDGVILMAPTLSPHFAQLVLKNRRPIVMLNVCRDLKKVVSFNINNYQGATVITEHLIKHGYQKIGMIKGPEGNCDADERYRGYIDTTKKYGIPINKDHIIPGDFTDRSGYYGFIRLMSQQEKPDAVFAANDMMAVGIYNAARRLAIKIPDHVAIVGFDDIFLSSILQPRLTTVHVPILELGSKAIRCLFKMINGEIDPQSPHREELTTGLITGGSCGCQFEEVALPFK